MTVIPAVADKVIRMTAAFEGHSTGYAAGNSDGQVLTWGPIGHALKSGSLHGVLRRIVDLDPDASLPDPLIRAVKAGRDATISYAKNQILRTNDARRVRVDWQGRFVALYHTPEAQQAFREAAQRYLRVAELAAKKVSFVTERGFALCFDIVVQNGRIKSAAMPMWRQLLLEFAAHPDHSSVAEWVRMKALAYAVAAASNPRWRNDVLSRKLTCAVGSGEVHGKHYILSADFGIVYTRNWEIQPKPARKEGTPHEL